MPTAGKPAGRRNEIIHKTVVRHADITN